MHPWSVCAVGKQANSRHIRQAWAAASPQVAATIMRMPEELRLIAKHVEKHGRIRPELNTTSDLRVGTFAEDVFTAENATPQ